MIIEDKHRYEHLVHDHLFPKDLIIYHPSRKPSRKKLKSIKNDNKNSIKTNANNNNIEMINDNDNDVYNDNNDNDDTNYENIMNVDNTSDVNKVRSKKSKKTCRFYLSSTGCRAGDDCLFSHNIVIPSNTTCSDDHENNIKDKSGNDMDIDIDELTKEFTKKVTIPKISFGRNRRKGFA